MNNAIKAEKSPNVSRMFAFVAIVAGTVLGLAGIDLVLPSVPEFPELFDTTTTLSQLVLAAFVAGNMIGLITFGSLAVRFGRRRLFIGSLFFYAGFSFAAGYSPSIETLVAVRFLQGIAASGAAVIAPGLIRHLFSELGAVRAISAMGSIEALVPGLAPIAGAWLHQSYGWTASFFLTSLLVGIICAIVVVRPKLLPHIGTKANLKPGSYLSLTRNKFYLRYALSHAAVLGGLLTFVFTAPAVIIKTMDGSIADFINMQMVGVGFFIVFANFSGSLVKRWGTETTVMLGTIVSAFGALALLGYALFGNNKPGDLIFLFWILNTGLGIRGGPGFLQALVAAQDDDDRAAALMLVAVTALAAAATAAVAPFIGYGLPALTFATCLIILPALLLMLFIKPYRVPPPAKGS